MIEKHELSKNIKKSTIFTHSTLTGLTPEPSETSKIAPKLLQGLQGISQWPPRTPLRSQGLPRRPKGAPQTRQKGLNSCSGRCWNNNISSEIDIEANIGTYLSCWVPTKLQFWPGGMRAAIKSAVSNGYMASMKGYVRPPVPWGGLPPLTPPPAKPLPPTRPNDCFWNPTTAFGAQRIQQRQAWKSPFSLLYKRQSDLRISAICIRRASCLNDNHRFH